MNVMLFNRDLRLRDNQPLAEAAKLGEFLPLYIFDPSEWEQTALTVRHFEFLHESLEELSAQLQQRGGKLFMAIGEPKEILSSLWNAYGSIAIFASRDILKKDSLEPWLKESGQKIYTYGLKTSGKEKEFKAEWSMYIHGQIAEPPVIVKIPEKVPEFLFTDINRLKRVEVTGTKIRFGQQGGELKAWETLDSFLGHRCLDYIANHQKPIPSSMSSSRLSAYIAWGNLSVRTIFQKASSHAQSCGHEGKKQIDAFLAHLYSHDKTIYISTEKTGANCLKRGWNDEWHDRWLAGKTGIPFVDAAMRSLEKTGWLNFTLREMAISFISNTLMLDPENPADGMAGLLLDYDPDIHIYNVNKITGLQGNKKIKLIDPVNLGKKLDPDGVFIRRYVFELGGVPAKYIHEPWTYPGFYQLGYEAPIIDVKKANKAARYSLQGTSEGQSSRKQRNQGEPEQLSFDL